MDSSTARQISDLSKLVFEVSHNDNQLFDYLEQLPDPIKKEILASYSVDSGPILAIRKQVAQRIANGNIDRQFTIAQFDAGKRASPKSFAPYKGLYSILYPFVLFGKEDIVYDAFYGIAGRLREDLGLTDKTDIKVVGFDGARNTGSDDAWFAIYNNSYPSQREAKQLFFSLRNGVLHFALYDRAKNAFIAEGRMDFEEFEYERIFAFFLTYKGIIENDNARASLLVKYPVNELKDKLERGIIKAWMIKPGRKGNMWKDALKDEQIRIGWGHVIGDIYAQNDFTEKFVLEKLYEHYPDLGERQTNNKSSILFFVQDMSEGDILLAISGKYDLIGIGIVTSDVILDEEEEEFKATRNVDWLIDLQKRPYSPDFEFPQKTVTNLDAEYAIPILSHVFSANPTFLIENEYKMPDYINTILYGPPGTGKTYELNQLKRGLFTDTIPAADTDTLLREEVSGYPYWQVIAAILYDTDKSMSVNAICDHALYRAKYNPTNKVKPRNIAWGQLQALAEDKSTKMADKYRKELQLFEKNKKSEWSIIAEQRNELPEIIDEELLGLAHNPALVGANQPLIKERFRWVTFHQKYSYEDFIEGIKPILQSELEDDIAITGEGSGLQFELKKGLFYNASLEALQLAGYESFEDCRSDGLDERRRKFATVRNVRDKQFALLIDEINRANISAVFGELITLIEEDKRIGGQEEVWVKLPYSGDDFCVPPNLWIIGTMNTADKSIALLDIALRRRFEFKPIYPKYSLENEPDPWWGGMLEQLNEAIYQNKNRNPDFFIGHSFFMDKTREQQAEVFNRKIIPLLSEYFQNNMERVERVLQAAGIPFKKGTVRENYQLIAE